MYACLGCGFVHNTKIVKEFEQHNGHRGPPMCVPAFKGYVYYRVWQKTSGKER